jgi:Xaa-Pro aminopeptidase
MLSMLPSRLQRIVEAEYPRFSATEMARRRASVEALLSGVGADHLVFCGANRFGSAVQWLTQWPVTAEAVGVFTPGHPDALFVQYFNHVPLARKLADQADVAWGGDSAIVAAMAALDDRGAKPDRVAVIGPLTFEQHDALAARFGRVTNLNKSYVRLRMLKSEEEIDWLRIGAHLSDRAIAALTENLAPGMSERELANVVERAYVADGGVNVIHYFGVTSMSEPQIAVPTQFPSTRRVARGDVVVTEISAAFWDYPGQVLRSFAVADQPTQLYRDLHAVAEAAFDAIVAVLRDGASAEDVIAASGVIEEAGFSTIDDLVHGYGGGYLPPILGSKSRSAGQLPKEPFKAGMTVVVQPNVITPDQRAGVQTGELVLITTTGIERLHAMPRGFATV